VAQHPLEYRKMLPEAGLAGSYAGHYAWMDPSRLYVKIDDDVVFIADDAIELMVRRRCLDRLGTHALEGLAGGYWRLSSVACGGL
jgi:hypothetical protein